MAKGKFVNGEKRGKWIERNKDGKKEKKFYKQGNQEPNVFVLKTSN